MHNCVYTSGAGSGTRARQMWFIQELFLSKPPSLPLSIDLGTYEGYSA